MRTRAVVFDYFGTLTPSVRSMVTAGELGSIGAVLGLEPAAMDAQWRASFTERCTGASGDLATTLRTLANRAGATPDDAAVAEAARIRTDAYRRAATPRTDAVEVLGALRTRGLRLAVVSDCSLELADLWPELPLAGVVEATVFSAVVGRRKPDPLLYRSACERLGVTPAECLYVGDGGSGELTGAEAFGMRAALLADEGWTDAIRYDDDVWAGPVIHALAEVPRLVDGDPAATGGRNHGASG